ncbi:MAG: integration host factor subunit beta [Lentisphaeria bacterium]|nr:integration host factor subunit beta [Lentisphaeria bacterium]
MTKRDIIVKIAEESKTLTQAEVGFVVQRTLDAIVEELAAGRNIELRNFGVFEIRVTKKRVGRNPAKPENEVVIPERSVVKFRSGRILREKVGNLVK